MIIPSCYTCDKNDIITNMYDFKSQKMRSIMYNKIRRFFDDRDYLEVFTPTLSDTLIPEANIQNFQTRFENEFEGSKDLYMIPSPEIFMKRLLAAGSPSIYQISSCFRNSEQLGRIHNPEFTMLEYYTLAADEMDSIKITEDLMKEIAFEDTPSWAKPPFITMSVNEAMIKWTGVDLDKCQKKEVLRQEAIRLGQNPEKGESWDDIFNRIFLTYVETSLPTEHPVILTDYPMQIECLALQKEGTPYRKRWEMYINGTEVANCYAEETSPLKTEDYYQREYQKLIASRENTALPIPDISSTFPSLEIPTSSGVAIGLDRLLMSLLGKDEIAPLLLFPLSDMIHDGL